MNHLRILFFASLREITGCEAAEWSWPAEGGTVEELLAQLYQRFDGLRRWDECLLVAADCAYVSRTSRLFPGQEIAIMPPVQGG